MAAQMKFADLAKLTDREIQLFLREVHQRDLVTGLKGAGKAVREKCLGNMSKRVRGFIGDEIAACDANSGEILETQGRIIMQIFQLVEQGQITWPREKKSPKKAKSRKPDKEYQTLKRELRKEVTRTLEQMSMEEVDDLFFRLSQVARKEGILALEEFSKKMTDPFIQQGFELIIDGTEPALIMDIMETWLQSRVHEFKRKNQKVIEAIMATQAGDNPRIIKIKTSKLY